MSARNEFNGVISDWLDDQAGRGAPDYLDEILVRTTRTRQRPAWSSLERWLPVQMTFTGRLAPIPRLAWLFALLLMVALVAVALIAIGVGQRRLPHFGAAANGQFAFMDGPSMKVAGADGTNVRTAVVLPDGAVHLTFSPDGSRLAYGTTGAVSSIVVADADGSHPVVVAAGAAVASDAPFAWSPDSRRIAFTMALIADKIGTIDVVDADGSHLRQLIDGGAAEATDRYSPAWSPDGQWIAYFASATNGYVVLNVIHPDGTGEHSLSTTPANPDLGQLAWSPDPAQSRIAFPGSSYVDVFDLTSATETSVGAGFWPTWSPDGRTVSWWSDGTNLVSFADLVANRATPKMIFPIVGGSSCQEHPDLAGKAICGPAEWSPDGLWIYGPDVLGKSIVFGRADGSGHVRSIPLAHPIDLASGPTGLLAWQAVAP